MSLPHFAGTESYLAAPALVDAVNVAVALGKLFYDEPVGVKELAAMLVIFLGVGIVKRFSRPS